MISIGTVLATYLCFNQLTSPLRELHRILDEFSESMVLAGDYFDIVEIPEDFSYRALESGKNIPENEAPEICLEKVVFSYPEKKKMKSCIRLIILLKKENLSALQDQADAESPR